MLLKKAMPAESCNKSNRIDPSIWKITSVAALGSFLSQMDATVVNVSLPSLAVMFHSSLSLIQWVTSGYLLALALVLPLSGWMVDRIGAKAVYAFLAKRMHTLRRPTRIAYSHFHRQFGQE